MPHSSGGGSHGGGSHGGGSHGGSSHVSRSSYYRPGFHRYLYYSKTGPEFFYTEKTITPESIKSSKNSIIAIAIFLTLFYSIFLISISVLLLKKPKKLNVDYVSNIIISDGIGVISSDETEELYKVLGEFKDKTGITPCIYTTYNELWMDEYDTLERYAYDKYLAMFKDEKHWLIVYTEPFNNPTSYVDWYWEGMQGNDTDPILTSRKTKEFTKKLQALLERDDVSVGQSLINEFSDFNGKVMKWQLDVGLIFALIFILIHGSIFYLGFIGVPLSMLKKDKKAILIEGDPQKQLDEAECKYCGKRYVVGLHTRCPYCNAEIPPESFEFYYSDYKE